MITVDYMNVVVRSERRRISMARGFGDVGDIRLVLFECSIEIVLVSLDHVGRCRMWMTKTNIANLSSIHFDATDKKEVVIF